MFFLEISDELLNLFCVLFHLSLEFYCLGFFFICHKFFIMCLITPERLGLLAYANDFHTVKLVALGNGVNHFLIGWANHFTKHCMFSIKPRGRFMSDEKLAAVSSWARVGHRKNTGAYVF